MSEQEKPSTQKLEDLDDEVVNQSENQNGVNEPPISGGDEPLTAPTPRLLKPEPHQEDLQIEDMTVKPSDTAAKVISTKSETASITSPSKATLARQKNKQVLLSYQNRPQCCQQLWDLVGAHMKQLYRHACAVIALMILVPIYCIGQFAYIRSATVDKTYPDYSLEKLKHPVYSTAYYQPEYDEFFAAYSTAEDQQLEFESFMQFNNYTNADRATDEFVLGPEGEEIPVEVRSYLPVMDQLSPYNWIPVQCNSGVDYKYPSTVIGYIKHGNKLEEDLLSQIQGLHRDQTKISDFAAELEIFFTKITLGPPPPENVIPDPNESAGGVNKAPDAEGAEEEAELTPPDPNIWVIDQDLINEAGRGPEEFSVINVDILGEFTYVQFQSQEELFSYVKQPGYGWDADKPAVCFAFEVHENEAQNKYEVEFYFRDQWPYHSQTALRNDLDPTELEVDYDLMGYTYTAYNGINMMQVFAANSIMQRRLTPEAEIVLMTHPYKVKTYGTSAYDYAVQSLLSFFFLLILMPIAFHYAYAMGRERETGQRQTLIANGLGLFTHFSSWLLHYSLVNFFVSLIFVMCAMPLVFIDDDTTLIFAITFLSIESVFGMLWCLQPFFRSGRIAVFITAFFFFLSYYAGFIIDQKFAQVDTEVQKQICLAPVAAIKRTLETYSNWHIIKFPSTWDNYGREKRGFSLAIGMQMYLIDLVLWSFVGFCIEILMNIGMYFKSCFHMKFRFQNTSEGMIEISQLRARTKNAPIYEFALSKSTITCLVGNDSSQSTHLMEMLAGQRACKGAGSMTIKDGDFFARGNNPKLAEFVSYRSSNITLDDELTAVDHLNMYAHLRGSQKCKNTRILCEKLMPTNKPVKQFSESQRQCLQTLLALASENSRIILLDEPTRGLGPIQRSEIIKALWKFKRDRYILIASSDTEMINVLADSVAKMLPTGIQMVNAKPALVDNIKMGSYKLIVEVEGGKPSNGLVCYLSKDVPELTLDYHTDKLTYYVLSNISKALLYKKTKFLEQNRKMLGLIEFEVVSLTSNEIEARSIPREKLDERLMGSFDETIDDQEYAQVEQLQPHGDQRTILAPSDLLKSYKSDVNVIELQPESQRPMTELTDKRDNLEAGASDKDSSDLTDPNAISPEVEIDEEMRAFQELMDEPLRRPAYKRELLYDFRRYKPKRSFCCTQCCCICIRHTRDHCRNKTRFLALILMPSLFVFLSYHCARYLKQSYSQSRITSPDLLDLKQPILVNSKTQIGGLDTKKWIEKMPMYEEAFEATYIDTQDDEKFYGFRDACHDFSVNTVLEEPYNIGAYQFFEMDEERHKYKINSFLNLTNPYATELFPQFIIESVLKEALDDDDFEFKFRTTPMPAPFENTEKGSFVTSEDLYWNEVILTMSQAVGTYLGLSNQAIGCVSLAWLVINMITVTQLIRERTSQRKHFQEQHGQSKLAYWIARFCHDILFYMPISLMTAEMIEWYDPHMEQAAQSLMLQPFAMLPFLYCWSHFFTTEITGMLATGLYQAVVQWSGPQTLALMRLNYGTETMGDDMMGLFKTIPLVGAVNSMMFNSKTLYVLNRYREGNTLGEGEPIEMDEANEINAPADRYYILIHIVFFWSVLILLIEWKLHRYICSCHNSRMGAVSQEDNDAFFGKMERSGEMSNIEYDDGESSEVAQIIGDGEQLELRFNRKQTPKRELAYAIENLSLVRGGRCCRKKQYLISDLSAQVQAGSKFAIVSEGSQGATSILNTISDRKTAFNVAGIIRKQVGRGAPVYTTQSSDVLFADLSLSTNLQYYVYLGSIHPRFVKQMLLAFGLYKRKGTQVKYLTATEKHIAQLIIALAGAHKTVILDEPFTGLTQEQSVKLVKILRQKDDCTIIVTAKSKAQIELLQPQSVLTIRSKQETYKTPTSEGYVLAFRLKPFVKEVQPAMGERSLPAKDMLSVNQSMASFAGINNVDLGTFLHRNFRIFEKLRGKKRSLVVSAITKIMRKAKLSPEISEEIAEMVHEDMDLQMTNEELTLKCQLVRSLFALIEALCKRFGEVHLEQRQDDYAVLRVLFNETCRLKGLDDSFSDQNPVFSSVVEFVDSNDVVESCSLSCQFLGNGRTLQSGSRRGGGRPVVKTFRFSEDKQRMERTNPFHTTASHASLPSLN